MDSGHNCKDTQQYSEEYDAYYCTECNVWLEDICNDSECTFCQKRPERPLAEKHDDNA